jgi:hypothetical protein
VDHHHGIHPFSTPKDAAEEAYSQQDALTPRTGNSVVLGPDGNRSTLNRQNSPPKAKPPRAKPKRRAKAKPPHLPKLRLQVRSVFPPPPCSILPSKALTVEAWIMPDQPNGTILHFGGPLVGIALDLDQNKPRFHVRSESQLASIISKDTLNDGWTHLAATLAEDKTMRLYLNGLQVAEGKATGLLDKMPARPFYLGNGDGVAQGSTGGYSGLLDQFSFHTRALTAGEIESRFNAPETPPTGATLFCNFDNGDSRDGSGNALHGIGSGIETGKGKVGGALWFKNTPAAKGGGQQPGSYVKHTWDRFVPIVARSMALAGNTILVGGPPDTIDEEYAFERLAAKDPTILDELNEQNEALEGRRGAKMWAVNTQTGEQSTGLDLTAPPVWDGITSANGQVFVSTTDGKLQCFGK